MSLTLPAFAKTYLFSTNNRISFVSLNDTVARVLFGIKNHLVATGGYTVKYTCDGTTGPSSAGDHTDRWTDFSKCTTRFNGTGGAQSFCVLTDGSGVDILFTYNGASDEFYKVSMSTSGVFTPAGTANQQPTATDEQIIIVTGGHSGGSPISGLTSLDRIFHVMCSTDKKQFRAFTYRSSTMQSWLQVEDVTPAITAVSWNVHVCGWATNNSNGSSGTNGHVLVISSTGVSQGGAVRVGSTNVQGNGGGEYCIGSANNTAFGTSSQELQAASTIGAVGLYSNTASNVGKIGDRIDIWFMYANLVLQGDTFADNKYVWLATALHPWNGGPVLIA